MRALIVDDQIHVVNGILSGVDWERVGITQRLTAYSAFEARQLFREQQIDLLLCDIEMPVENGISLYRWVQEQGYGTECIFLTAHADFSYAQEAIRLGSFDYILQPARYEEIQAALQRAVVRIQRKGELKEYSAYGKAFSKNRSLLLDGVFREGVPGKSGEQLCKELGELDIPLSPSQEVCCLLLQPLSWREGARAWEEALLRYALENILSELFAVYHLQPLVVRSEEDYLVVLFPLEGGEERAPLFPGAYPKSMGTVEGFVQVCKEEIGVSLACYLAEPGPAGELFGQLGALRERKADNVANLPGIFPTGQGPREEPDWDAPMKSWEGMLANGNVLTVREEILACLDARSAENLLSAKSLKLFYQKLIQMLSVAAEARNVPLQEVLQNPELLDQYLTAYRSVEELKRLVDDVLPFFQGDTGEEEKQIDGILQYIYSHIESDLKRTEIARAVFLHPDTLSRVFRKEMGVTLKEFITAEKMKVARNLLKSTTLPIATIALRVGYSNFSHFSQSYKKGMGMTPEEERKA